MKTFTVVYRRARFPRNLRMVVQAYDEDDAANHLPENAVLWFVAPGLV